MIGDQQPLVGRDMEMARLAPSIERARGAVASAVLIYGEPGIGKTRLAWEALTLARKEGFATLVGTCSPLAAGMSYGPFLEGLGSHFRLLDAGTLRRLTGDLPDLGLLFPQLPLSAPEPLGDPALEKGRLFEAVARLLERISMATGLAVLIDDAHWADRASLELLSYAARTVASTRFLLLISYRDEDVHARPFRSLLQSLRRVLSTDEISLGRLARSDVAELARRLLGGEPDEALVGLLERRSAGTPLFVSALVRSLVERKLAVPTAGGWSLAGKVDQALPPDVSELLRERLDRLTRDDRAIAELIAAAGGSVPHPVLIRAAGIGEKAAVARVDRLRASGLVVEDIDAGPVSYRLSHPLIQEVIYSSIAEMARRRLHLALAKVFEERDPDGLLRIAHHYRLAGDLTDRRQGLVLFTSAGDRAMQQFANDEASRNFEAALELARQDRPEEVAALLERLGDAWRRLGEGSAAMEVWQEALAAYQRNRDALGVARVTGQMAVMRSEQGDPEQALDLIALGLEGLRDRSASIEHAALWFSRSIVLQRAGDGPGVLECGDRLLELAEQLGSPSVRAQALMAGADIKTGDPTRARADAVAALAAAEEAGELTLIQGAHILAGTAAFRDDLKLAIHHFDQSIRLAAELGSPDLELVAQEFRCIASYFHGEWDVALQIADAAILLARRLEKARRWAGLLALSAMVFGWRGEHRLAQARLRTAREVAGPLLEDEHVRLLISLAEINLALALGNPELVDRVEPPRITSLADFVRPFQAEAQALAGDTKQALESARRLAAETGVFSSVRCLAQRAEGVALRMLGDTRAAAACFEEASRGLEEAGMPFEAARTRLELVLLGADPDPARLQQCLELFERLRARPLRDRARRALRMAGLKPAARRTASGPLSEREVEVARLAAEGLTSAEIARRLVISPHTAAPHLKRIYARLEIRSRLELARFVEANYPDGPRSNYPARGTDRPLSRI